MNATPEQISAIETRGRVIVSASAGSGKTFVMIERLAGLILSGTDIRNTLSVTFTNKAAAQMRDRLRTEHLKRMAACPAEERARLKEQLKLLPQADISTIHAFCSRLVRANFFLADVSPAFRVISPEDAEGRMLSARALEEVFESAYEEGDGDFLRLLGAYYRKKDAALKKLVVKLYGAVRMKADYRELLAAAGADLFDKACACIFGDIRDRAELLAEEFEKLGLFFAEHFNAGLTNCREGMDAVRAVLAADGLFALRDLPAPKFSRSPQATKLQGDKLKYLMALRAAVTATKKLYEFPFEDEETERMRAAGAAKVAGALGKLLLRYDEALDRLKREAGVLDYDDLEHCALKILQNDEARRTVRERYRYLFVDEYQDVNPAQERILSLIGGEEIFLVGDAKQAIYGFRGGRSEYFLKKEKEFEHPLVLSGNFRSAPAVLDAVNRVFSRAMTEELVYHPVMGSGRYGEHAGEVRFHFVSPVDGQQRSPRGIYSVMTDSEPEPDYVAERVASLIHEEIGREWYDTDENLVKRVTYGDIAVLVRKNKGCADSFVAALSRRGIPVTTTASVNVCDFWEARLLIDWLSYLDNGEQDIPLAGAMLSRIGGFTDSELAAVRMRFPSLYTFRAACGEYRRRMGDALAQKLDEFFARAERYRALMRVRTAAEMMALLLSDGLEAEIAAKKDGKTRLRRVRRLMSGTDNVNTFLRKLKTLGYFADYSETGGERSVKVLTIHSAKGLEYPVVIVVNLETPFHSETEEVFFTEELSFAPKFYDAERRVVAETVVRRASALLATREGVKEELNLLYVAMTRAKYRLHLVFGSKETTFAPRYAKSFAEFIDLDDCASYFAEEEERLSPPLPHNALAYRPDEKRLAELKGVYCVPYPYPESTRLPVKSSATDLMRSTREETPTRRASAAPTVDEGLAYHAFLEHVRYGRGAEEELARMKEESILGEEELSLLDAERLDRILALPSLKAVAQLGAERIRREQTFLVAIPACEIGVLKTGAQDEIVLQGAIDLLAEEREGYLILDYKFSSHEAERLKADYAPQISLYKKAVARTLGVREETIRARLINLLRLEEVEM